ncbi:MAG: hypothetical protein AAB352_03095 [Patescibacteria group bacterium]
MKKSLILLFVAGILVLPFAASAIVIGNPPSGGINSVEQVVNAILTPVWQVFIGIAVLMIIVAGILFLTAAGDADKITTARHAFLWGIVGIVVGIIAFSIVAIVRGGLGV